MYGWTLPAIQWIMQQPRASLLGRRIDRLSSDDSGWLRRRYYTLFLVLPSPPPFLSFPKIMDTFPPHLVLFANLINIDNKQTHKVSASRAFPPMARICRPPATFRPSIITTWDTTITQLPFSSSRGVRPSITTWLSRPTQKVSSPFFLLHVRICFFKSSLCCLLFFPQRDWTLGSN